MNQTSRKIVFFIVVQVIFYNSLYLIFIPELYSIFWYAIALGLYYIISFVDTILRPLQDEERDPEAGKYTIILILLLLTNPLFLILAFMERKTLIEPYIPFWNQELITQLGIVFYVLAGIIMLIGRIQLGRYATGKLSIQENHELIEKGLYKFIRHPIYIGVIASGLFYLIIFNSIVTAVFYTVILFVLFNKRADYEEKILQKKFGSEYEEYRKRTKRYIPYLY